MRPRFTLYAMSALLAAAPAPVAAQGQTFSMNPSGGVVLPLADGRLAVLMTRAGATVVDGLVPADSVSAAAPLNIRVGDRVTRFKQTRTPSLEQVSRAWDALAEGDEVSLTLARGEASVEVRFAKPRARSGEGRRMAIAGGASGSGAWTTAGPPPLAATEVVIAGSHLRDNDQGMPQVMFQSSHPAAATVPLRTGDVVQLVNGRTISALAGLELLYNRITAGAEVVLTVQRGGRQETLRFAKPAP